MSAKKTPVKPVRKARSATRYGCMLCPPVTERGLMLYGYESHDPSDLHDHMIAKHGYTTVEVMALVQVEMMYVRTVRHRVQVTVHHYVDAKGKRVISRTTELEGT